VEGIMSTRISPSYGKAPANGPKPAIVVKRIRFLEQAPDGARVRRQFTQPHRGVAVEEGANLADLPADRAWPEPTDQLVVVFVPRACAAEWQKKGAGWLDPPDHPEAAPAVVLERDGHAIHWRPGRAVVLGRVEHAEAVLDALVDFAFHEGELRRLEQALAACEAGAEGDVARAHCIRARDRRAWVRLGETIEHLNRMRLAYARLEPRLARPPRSLPVEARRVAARLARRADVEARLEAFSDRLEACEDLYEGANDRVADYRWYRSGHALEIAIIALLVLEVIIMTSDFYLRFLEYHAG
jgi:hypothetical protein